MQEHDELITAFIKPEKRMEYAKNKAKQAYNYCGGKIVS